MMTDDKASEIAAAIADLMTDVCGKLDNLNDDICVQLDNINDQLKELGRLLVIIAQQLGQK